MEAKQPVDVVSSSNLCIEDAETDLLLEAIYSVFGYDFRQYARSTLKRRLKDVAAKRGVANLSELQGRVLRDSELLNAVVSALSVQVSSFFRDSHFFLAFRRAVVPFLKTYPSLRLWHAGCATGEEVYSTAIVLMEEQLLNRSQIYATDINGHALEAASRGTYTAETISSSEPGYRDSGGKRGLADYFEFVGKRACFKADLKERINFFRHNLVTDNSFNEFHVILCRNVLIYFGKPLQDRVHELLYNSMVPFGVLGLGAHETLHLTPKQKRYRTLDDMARLYRRTD